jgi:uncharacterized membrane protein YbhN (UPF0104 family)
LLATLTALVALQVAGGVLSFWTGFGALGVRVGFLEATAAATLATLLSIISVTPGAVGIYEAAAAFVGATLAIAPINSVMASVVTRVVQIVLLLVLTPPAVFFLHMQRSMNAPAQESPYFENGVISRFFGPRVGRKEGPRVPH